MCVGFPAEPLVSVVSIGCALCGKAELHPWVAATPAVLEVTERCVLCLQKLMQEEADS